MGKGTQRIERVISKVGRREREREKERERENPSKKCYIWETVNSEMYNIFPTAILRKQHL
jgi:hypothetical protein